MKKNTVFLILLAAVLSACACFSACAEADKETVTGGVSFDKLLSDLTTAYEARLRIEADVKLMDNDVAEAIASHWQKVYLDPGYTLYLYGRDDPAGLPISGAHAFVVLGFQLQNGEMTDELKGRCDAAGAAAKAFPDSILVCTGGATGINNPSRHTEAGLMKEYLVNQCGIAPERVFTDEKALTTTENAVNTLAILREQGIETMTIVTSSYHQRWGQVLYNAMAARYRQQYGYSAEIIANYCFDIAPSNPLFIADAMIAITQLKSILALPLDAQ